MNRLQLESEIFLLLDGELEDGRIASLETLLLESTEAREIYQRCARLHSALAVRMRGGYVLENWNVVPIQRIVATQRQKTVKLSLVAALALLLGIGALLWLRMSADNASPRYSFQVTPGSVFSVTSPEGKSLGQSEFLVSGSRLKMTSGNVECMLEGGVRTLIAAPLDLTLETPGRVRLEEGSAWFHVPTGAVGFTVRTPEIEAVDLGTEFGVFSSPGGDDEVHVFRGKVAVSSLNPLKEKQVLTSGQARFTDAAGRLRIVPTERDRFLKSLPSEPNHLYFSFDSETDGALTVEGTPSAASNFAAAIKSGSPGSSLIPGISGNALSLNGENEWVETDWPGTAGDLPRSVSFWLRIPKGAMPGRNQPAIIGWGNDDDSINGKWKIWATRTGSPHLHLRVSFGAQNLDSARPLDDGKWHHIAVSYSGNTPPGAWPEALVWIDGKPPPLQRVSSKESPAKPPTIDTETESINARPLRLGIGLKDSVRSFLGDIDELDIFEKAISEETVKTLYLRAHNRR